MKPKKGAEVVASVLSASITIKVERTEEIMIYVACTEGRCREKDNENLIGQAGFFGAEEGKFHFSLNACLINSVDWFLVKHKNVVVLFWKMFSTIAIIPSWQ